MSNKLPIKKILSARQQSAAAAAETKLGPTVPQGMKLYVISLRMHNSGAVATTLNVYSGIAAAKTQTTKIAAMPILANNAIGAHDAFLEGSIEKPVMVVEPGLAAAVRSNTELYLGDGGQRVDVEMEYIIDF